MSEPSCPRIPAVWMDHLADNRPGVCSNSVNTDQDSAFLTLLERLAACPQERLLITIDGPCGSGKSTLAARLGEVIDAPVLHMDDYVIPHARKTPERLAIPGGNADVERLQTEILLPWLAGEAIVTRPYLCHEDRLGNAVTLQPGHCLILEGTYCNLPVIAQHASLRLFLTVSPQEQQRRLLQRVGPERLQAFNSRWIPLEKAYFAALHLPDAGCYVLPQEV